MECKQKSFDDDDLCIDDISIEHPSEFCCPITLCLISEPVLLFDDGHTYDKSALNDWLKSNNTSPITNQTLKSKQYQINYALKSQIQSYIFTLNNHNNNINHISYFKSHSRKDHENGTNYVEIQLQLCGDRSVGKTSIRKYLEFNEKNPKTQATLGIDYCWLQLKSKFKSKDIVVCMSDVQGHFDDFQSMASQCYRNIHCAIMVCSIDRPNSVESLKNNWYKDICRYAPDNCYCMVLLNKMDLLNENNENVMNSAIEFAKENRIPIYNTSCVNGDYIHCAVKELIDRVVRDENVWKQLIDERNNDDEYDVIDLDAILNGIDESENVQNKNKTKCCSFKMPGYGVMEFYDDGVRQTSGNGEM